MVDIIVYSKLNAIYICDGKSDLEKIQFESQSYDAKNERRLCNEVIWVKNATTKAIHITIKQSWADVNVFAPSLLRASDANEFC